MVNKQNIALALGKIEEINVLMEDLMELVNDLDEDNQCECFSVMQAGKRADDARMAIFSTQGHLKEAMNEN